MCLKRKSWRVVLLTNVILFYNVIFTKVLNLTLPPRFSTLAVIPPGESGHWKCPCKKSCLDESSIPDNLAKVGRARARPGDILEGDSSAPMFKSLLPFPGISDAFVKIGIDEV